MWRRVRDGLTAAVLGGFVLLEPPIGADAGGTWSADTGVEHRRQLRAGPEALRRRSRCVADGDYFTPPGK